MSKLELKIAGCIALINAALFIPVGLGVLYYSAGTVTSMTKTVLSILTVLSTGVLVYLVLTLKRYVQKAFNFHEIDQAAGAIIVAAILYAANDIVATLVGQSTMLNNINIGLLVYLGLANIYFAFKFNKLEDNLFGLRKSYCVLTAATGALLASVFLSPLYVIPGLVSDIMLGTMFLLASKAARSAENIS
jgi:hypothetical protein